MADISHSASELLRTEFLRDAKVIDVAKSYISVSSFNLRMKPAILKAAGGLIAQQFSPEKITAVHGIPHSGNYLATAVSLALSDQPAYQTLDLRLHSSRKDQVIPTSWKDVYRKEIKSFTTSSGGVDVFSGINLSFVKKGDRILLIDDVCASGDTGYRIVQGLQEKGAIVVGFAVLFDKVFQGGLDRIAQMGVKTFSCIRVLKIGKNDNVILQTSDLA